MYIEVKYAPTGLCYFPFFSFMSPFFDLGKVQKTCQVEAVRYMLDVDKIGAWTI